MDSATGHSIPFTVKVAAWLLAILLTVVCAEFAARVVFPQPDVLNIDRLAYSPRAVSGALLEQATLAHATIRVDSSPDNASSLHLLNLNGFRDVEWTMEKTANRRIFMVGDSMVEGFLATEARTIPKVFETRARTAGAAIDVWNLGIGGAGPSEYVKLIRDAVPAYKPDELFLVLHANDLLGEVSFAEPSTTSFVAKPRKASGLRLVSAISQVLSHEPIARAWHSKPFGFFAAVPDPSNPWTRNGQVFDKFVQPDIAQAMRQGSFNPFNVDEVHGFARYLPNPVDPEPWLKVIKNVLDVQGVKLFVVYIPQTNQTTDHYLPYRQRFSTPNVPSLTSEKYQAGAVAVSRATRKLEIPFLDMTPLMVQAEARGEHLYWNYDEHLLPAGYAFVANRLHEWRMQFGAL